jgi:hypothetical protein
VLLLVLLLQLEVALTMQCLAHLSIPSSTTPQYTSELCCAAAAAAAEAIDFDPAFEGLPVERLINNIVANVELSGNPGEAPYSYNNFGKL